MMRPALWIALLFICVSGQGCLSFLYFGDSPDRSSENAKSVSLATGLVSGALMGSGAACLAVGYGTDRAETGFTEGAQRWYVSSFFLELGGIASGIVSLVYGRRHRNARFRALHPIERDPAGVAPRFVDPIVVRRRKLSGFLSFLVPGTGHLLLGTRSSLVAGLVHLGIGLTATGTALWVQQRSRESWENGISILYLSYAIVHRIECMFEVRGWNQSLFGPPRNSPSLSPYLSPDGRYRGVVLRLLL